MDGCTEKQAELSAYLDGELNAAERSALDQHLQACQECRDTLAQLRSASTAVSNLPQMKAPPSFAAAIRKSIEAEKVAPAKPERILRAGSSGLSFQPRYRWAPIAVGLAAALLLCLLAFVVLQSLAINSTPVALEPPSTPAVTNAPAENKPEQREWLGTAKSDTPVAGESAPKAVGSIVREAPKESLEMATAPAPDPGPAGNRQRATKGTATPAGDDGKPTSAAPAGVVAAKQQAQSGNGLAEKRKAPSLGAADGAGAGAGTLRKNDAAVAVEQLNKAKDDAVEAPYAAAPTRSGGGAGLAQGRGVPPAKPEHKAEAQAGQPVQPAVLPDGRLQQQNLAQAADKPGAYKDAAANARRALKSAAGERADEDRPIVDAAKKLEAPRPFAPPAPTAPPAATAAAPATMAPGATGGQPAQDAGFGAKAVKSKTTGDAENDRSRERTLAGKAGAEPAKDLPAAAEGGVAPERAAVAKSLGEGKKQAEAQLEEASKAGGGNADKNIAALALALPETQPIILPARDPEQTVLKLRKLMEASGARLEAVAQADPGARPAEPAKRAESEKELRRADAAEPIEYEIVTTAANRQALLASIRELQVAEAPVPPAESRPAERDAADRLAKDQKDAAPAPGQPAAAATTKVPADEDLKRAKKSEEKTRGAPQEVRIRIRIVRSTPRQ